MLHCYLICHFKSITHWVRKGEICTGMQQFPHILCTLVFWIYLPRYGHLKLWYFLLWVLWFIPLPWFIFSVCLICFLLLLYYFVCCGMVIPTSQIYMSAMMVLWAIWTWKKYEFWLLCVCFRFLQNLCSSSRVKTFGSVGIPDPTRILFLYTAQRMHSNVANRKPA
jgi:hypothetical protein